MTNGFSVPHFLQFEMTYGCNSHCVFCYNPSRERQYPPELTWKIVHAISEAQVPLVQLTGGEVTTLHDLNAYAEYLSRTSKVSIVTNGIRRCDLSPDIRKVFVSLHGNKATHERITVNPETYETIIETIQYYVSRGFCVAADVILSADNYTEMYDIIRTAAALGMSEVYINRFQGGGFGTSVLKKLMPPVQIFREAVGQMIAGRNDFKIPVVFGTSVPLCIDERIVTEGFGFNCDMGIKFAAIAPDGEVRACNQALKGYGNLTRQTLEEIWQSEELNDYRDKSWVTGVCKDCPLLDRCGAGCRVDNSQMAHYCTDAFVRHMDRRPDVVEKILALEDAECETAVLQPSPFTGRRLLRAEEGLLINRKHPEKYLVRDNYSTLVVDDVCAILCSAAQSATISEKEAWDICMRQYPELSPQILGRYVDHLAACGVIKIQEG